MRFSSSSRTLSRRTFLSPKLNSSPPLLHKFLPVSRDSPVLVDHLDSVLEGELILHVPPLVKDRSHRHLPGHVLTTHRRNGQGGHHQHHHRRPHLMPLQVSKVHVKKVGRKQIISTFSLRRSCCCCCFCCYCCYCGSCCCRPTERLQHKLFPIYSP